MIRLIVSFAALAALCAPVSAIVGGTNGGDAAAHTVMITSRAEDCSGTAIARDLVITAAHCLRHGVALYVNGIAVVRSAIHPRYRADSYDRHRPSPDLAILKLSAPLPPNIGAAPLSTDAKLPPHDVPFLIAGWGVATEGDRRTVGQLRVARLPSVGNTGNIMVRLSLRSAKSLRGSCDGDSGGSVYREMNGQLVLAGVIAWATGPGRHTCGDVTGATLVGIQIAWIRKAARDLGSPLSE